MRINHVRHALKAGKLQLGLGFGQLRSPEVARLLAAAGFQLAELHRGRRSGSLRELLGATGGRINTEAPKYWISKMLKFLSTKVV